LRTAHSIAARLPLLTTLPDFNTRLRGQRRRSCMRASFELS
jgi:hypothetical protein